MSIYTNELTCARSLVTMKSCVHMHSLLVGWGTLTHISYASAPSPSHFGWRVHHGYQSFMKVMNVWTIAQCKVIFLSSSHTNFNTCRNSFRNWIRRSRSDDIVVAFSRRWQILLFATWFYMIIPTWNPSSSFLLKVWFS